MLITIVTSMFIFGGVYFEGRPERLKQAKAKAAVLASLKNLRGC